MKYSAATLPSISLITSNSSAYIISNSSSGSGKSIFSMLYFWNNCEQQTAVWQPTHNTQHLKDLCQMTRFCFLLCAILFFTSDAGLLATSQYSEGPVTDHLNTGFSQFPCVYKQTLRRFPTVQVATTCLSCSPPDLNLLVTNFIFSTHVK